MLATGGHVMTEPCIEAVTNWDVRAGAIHFEIPRADCLLFVVASTRPDAPAVVDLSGEAPACLDSDRNRAVLRAFLRLALRRLDESEQPERRIELGR